MSTICIVALVSSIAVGLLLTFTIYIIMTRKGDKSLTCLSGRTAIVTGSNQGIGYHTALDFAKRGARVILACRDVTRAEEAKIKIIELTGNDNIVVKRLDLASLNSVREFAKDIQDNEGRLDILVNNAGAIGLTHSITEDGLSTLMQINYFGHFLLTLLLLGWLKLPNSTVIDIKGLLKKSAPSRIVNVSSSLARFACLKVDDLNAAPSGIFKSVTDYANTKLCNILFTNELARKLAGANIRANSVDPGPVRTDIARNYSYTFQMLISPFTKIFYKTPEEGAQTSIHVAVSKEIENVSGEFFSGCEISNSVSKGKDVNLAQRLWQNSIELVKLTENEKQILHKEFPELQV